MWEESAIVVEELRGWVVQLRGGLGAAPSFRREAWCGMLEIRCDAVEDNVVAALQEPSHPYAHQVALDVPRGMVFLQTESWSAAQREEALEDLAAVLHVTIEETRCHYYQGLHDVAAVLLWSLKSRSLATLALVRLVRSQFRGFVGASMDTTVAVLSLLLPLVEEVDAPLTAALLSEGMQPFFALPWILTWFAHAVHDLTVVTRLYDVFLATHPLMPLYTAAALCVTRRAAILEPGATAVDMQIHFQHIPEDVDWESVWDLAVLLYQRKPAAVLLQEAPASQKHLLQEAWPELWSYPLPWCRTVSLSRLPSTVEALLASSEAGGVICSTGKGAAGAGAATGEGVASQGAAGALLRRRRGGATKEGWRGNGDVVKEEKEDYGVRGHTHGEPFLSAPARDVLLLDVGSRRVCRAAGDSMAVQLLEWVGDEGLPTAVVRRARFSRLRRVRPSAVTLGEFYMRRGGRCGEVGKGRGRCGLLQAVSVVWRVVRAWLGAFFWRMPCSVLEVAGMLGMMVVAAAVVSGFLLLCVTVSDGVLRSSCEVADDTHALACQGYKAVRGIGLWVEGAGRLW
jgi:hypothetical protein